MALKEKALRRLSDKFHSRSIPFAVGGEYMLNLRGLCPEWHQFDVYVSRSSWEEASSVLARLGMKSGSHAEEKWCEASFHFDGADICLHAGLPCPDGFSLVIPGSGLEETDVFGSSVPLLPLADWLAVCLLSHSEKDLSALRNACPDHAALACIQGAEKLSDLHNI